MAPRLRWVRLLNATRIGALLSPEHSLEMEAQTGSHFERDYAKAVFSSPVRRLHDKTQVFPLEAHDGVRTRLSHSIEVSTVARSIAQIVGDWLVDQGDLAPERRRDIEAIAATCGVFHDIGNPPFGHAGEKSIQDWFTKKLSFGLTHPEIADFSLFEGNAQTIRLITKLQVLSSNNYGLNLTCGTLAAALKYTAKAIMVDSSIHERKKPGYFVSEEPIVEMVRRATEQGEARHPIAYLVEAADDSVYSFVDIEDAVRKGAASVQQLRDELDLSDELTKSVVAYADRLVPESLGPHRQALWTEVFRTNAVSHSASAAVDVFRKRYDAIMSGEYHTELLLDPESGAAPLIKKCKEFVRRHVYVWEDVLALEILGRRIIHDLLDILWEAAREYPFENDKRGFGRRVYGLISANYREVFEQTFSARGSLSSDYVRLQLITDYVSGMTDHFACSLLSKLSRPIR